VGYTTPSVDDMEKTSNTDTARASHLACRHPTDTAIMPMCLSNSQHDSMPMCLSNSHGDGMEMYCQTHKMVACRCVCRTHKITS
jgi:hypothetical protein